MLEGLPFFKAVLSFHLSSAGMRADPFIETRKEIANVFWRRDDVEWWGQSTFVIKVAQPQLCTGKLPLLVLVISYHLEAFVHHGHQELSQDNDNHHIIRANDERPNK